MGEHAIDQMMIDYKRMTGVEADRADFESEPRKRPARPSCALCKKKFLTYRAVRDHARDAHKKVAAA